MGVTPPTSIQTAALTSPKSRLARIVSNEPFRKLIGKAKKREAAGREPYP